MITAEDGVRIVNPRRVADCAADAYFDTVTLRCAACATMTEDVPSVLVGDESSRDAAGFVLSCRCPVGYASTHDASSCGDDGACRSVSCVACAETSLADGSACTTCANGTVDAATGDCACDSSSGAFRRLVDRDPRTGAAVEPSKACVACADGTFTSASSSSSRVVAGATYAAGDSSYECHACPDARRMAYRADLATCACGPGFEAVGLAAVGPLSCVSEAALAATVETYPRLLSPDAVTVEYFSIEQRGNDANGYARVTDSAPFAHLLVNASVLCRAHDGSPPADAACQTLANLCVLTGLNFESVACEVYSDLQGERGARRLPWLTYDADNVREDAGLRSRFDFSTKKTESSSTKNDVHREVDLRIATYTLNGTFVGIAPLETQFFYCAMPAPDSARGGGASRSTVWRRFGWSFEDSFECDLEALSHAEQLFHELYVADGAPPCDERDDDDAQLSSSSSSCLYPVPVLDKGLRDAAGAPANADDSRTDVFVRRFALYDVTSGRVADSTQSVPPDVVRYAHEITLVARAKTDDARRLYTPHLELKYRSRRRRDVLDASRLGRAASVRIIIEYSEAPARFRSIIRGVVLTVVGVGAAVFLVAFRKWHVDAFGVGGARSAATEPLRALVDLAVLAAHIFVYVAFPVVFGFCSYWFVYFKLQDTVDLLLPAHEGGGGSTPYYGPVRALLVALWIAQTVYVLKLVRDQSRQEVFLVDWEQPVRLGDDDRDKTTAAPNKKKKKHHKFDARHLDDDDADVVVDDDDPWIDEIGWGPAFACPVSTWRQVLVANEWGELVNTPPGASVYDNVVVVAPR